MGVTLPDDRRIQEIIDGLLREAGLDQPTFDTLTDWLRFEYGNRGYHWAHLPLSVGKILAGPQGFYPEACLPGSVAITLQAFAADIFDDIADQDNNQVPWRQISSAQALHLALSLVTLGYKALYAVRDHNLYRSASSVLQEMGLRACDGQLQEMQAGTHFFTSLDQYFEIIKKKAGALTEGAYKMGALLGGGSESLVRDIGQFGLRRGIISQIKNDLHDCLRFDVKNDFFLGKQTLPFVYLDTVLDGAAAEEFRSLQALARQEPQKFSSENKERLFHILQSEGAAHYCATMCSFFKQEALDLVEEMSLSKNQKEQLSGLI